jgi:crossover junction endodeoxyribonuclease RusA
VFGDHEAADNDASHWGDFAADDFQDIKSCDLLIAFTEADMHPRGSRHVELGIALALGKKIIVVGPRENVFCCLPQVMHLPTVEPVIGISEGAIQTIECGSTIVEFFVPGDPAPAGSKRGFYIPKLKRVVITDACKRTKPWQAVVSFAAADAWGDARPMTNPVRLELVFRLQRPGSHFGTRGGLPYLKDSAPRYPTTMPDLLKLTRAIEDACTGILYRDDSQIVEEDIKKVYTTQTVGVIVRVSPMPVQQRLLENTK